MNMARRKKLPTRGTAKARPAVKNLSINNRYLAKGLMKKNTKTLLITSVIFVIAVLAVATTIYITKFVLSSDGSGTNSVSPGTSTAGATGDTQTFTFTAAETMGSGEISITVPSGWSAPQGSSGTAGYTTATSAAGTVADVKDNADSATGWVAGNACTNGLSLDTSVKHEGGGSVQCANGNEGAGNRWYKNITSENWSGYTRVGFWIRSSGSISDTNLRFGYDNSANLASPLEQISFGQVIPANTWTYVVLNFGATTRTSVVSFGFVIRDGADLDNENVWIDDLLIGPGVPTYPGGNEIRARILQLTSGQTMTVTYGAGGGTSGATVPTAAGSYNFLTQSKVSDAGTLTNIASSPTVTVGAGAISQFTLTDPGNIGAGERLGYTVTRKDQYGNTVLSGTSTVYLYSSSAGANKRFYDAATGGNIITSVTIGNGQPSKNFWYYDEAPGTYTITTSDNTTSPDGTTGIDDATDSVTISGGAVAEFILNDPGNLTSGARAPYSVSREDQFGNLVTTGSTTVYLYSNSGSMDYAFYDAATGGSQITSINIGSGNSSANFWYYDELADTWTITASDNATSPDGATGASDGTDSITVLPGATSHFVLNDPGDTTAGTRLGYTVTRQDQFGNVVTSGTNTVYLYSDSSGLNYHFYNAATGGSITSSRQITSGQSTANFWYYDELAGTFSITASDNSSTPDGNLGIDDSSDSVIISGGAVSKFSLNDPGDMTAETRLGYIVTRKDQYNNPATSGFNTIYLYSTSVSPAKAFFNAASGGNQITSASINDGQSTANFWYYDDLAGIYTITSSDNATFPDDATGIDDATDLLTVNAIPIVATRFTILDPTDGTVDAPITVTIRAEDDSNNVDTTYQNDVTLVASSSATGEGLVNIVNGLGTLNLSDTVAETVNLSLSDTEGTGLVVTSAQGVIFSAGAAAKFFLNDPGNTVAGTRLGYTVTRKDQFENLTTTGTTVVYLYTNSSGTTTFYDSDVGGNEILHTTILSGQSDANFWYYDELSGTPTVTASDNSSSPNGATGIDDDTDTLTIGAGVLAKFTLNDPGDMSVETRLGYTVTRKDNFNNLITSGGATVSLYSNSASANKSFYDAATGGSIINSTDISAGNSAANFWYYDDTAGTYTITVSDNSSSPDGVDGTDDGTDAVIVSAVPIVATRFSILNPTDVTVGSNAIITVRAEDNSGNVDTTYQNDVTLVTSGSATGEGLVDIVNGIGTITVSDNISEIVILSLTDSEGTGLNISSTQDIVFLSTSGGSGGISIPAEGAPTLPVSLTGATLSFSGRAFPNAKITILGRGTSQDIPLKSSLADASGGFNINFVGALPAAAINAYKLTFEDKEGRTTETPDSTPEQITSFSATDIFAPPTLGFGKSTFLREDLITLAGYAMPGNKIEIEIDEKQIPREIFAGNDGSFKLSLTNFDYAFGSHKARIRQRDSAKRASDFSLDKIFTIAKVFAPNADLNDDGKSDISDWSIFLFRWGSPDQTKKSTIDFNNDGRVDISDFSIFLQSLTATK